MVRDLNSFLFQILSRILKNLIWYIARERKKYNWGIHHDGHQYEKFFESSVRYVISFHNNRVVQNRYYNYHTGAQKHWHKLTIKWLYKIPCKTIKNKPNTHKTHILYAWSKGVLIIPTIYNINNKKKIVKNAKKIMYN